MNPLLDTIKTSLELIREINASSVRDVATDRADEVLGRYGYSREPSLSSQILSHGASFGVGMAVGAGLGLIFAPQRGEATREKIADGASDVLTQLNGAVKDVWPTSASTDDAIPEERSMDPVRNEQRADTAN